MADLLREALDDVLVSWFSDRLSHRPRRGQSGVWLSVFRGSDQVWSGVHLVRSAWRCHDFTDTKDSLFANLCHVSPPPPRGKGDYHRLGHGSDDHVRRPRQVQGLQGKKVIAIATGSLHCVCCTEDGRSGRSGAILLFAHVVLVRLFASRCHLAIWCR